MATLDAILAERRRQERIRTDPTFAVRFQPIESALTVPPPPGGTTTTAPTPFAQTRAGLTFAAEQQRLLLGVQRTNQEALLQQQQEQALIRQQREQVFDRRQLQRRLDAEAKIRAEERERERQANISALRAERQAAFADLMRSGDQVRAVLFALGKGPLNDQFDVRARQLGTTVRELSGAQELRATTQTALSRVLDRDVTIGGEGVRGLGTAIGSARAFVQGGADVQTLLTSAFGVGSLREGEQPGISATRLAELIQEVTPTGVL